MALGACSGKIHRVDRRFFAGRFTDVVAPMAVVAGSRFQLSGQRGFFMNTILELYGGFRMAILTGEKMIFRRPLDIMAAMAVGAGQLHPRRSAAPMNALFQILRKAFLVALKAVHRFHLGMGNFLGPQVTGNAVQILMNRALVLSQVNKERELMPFRIHFFQSFVPMAA